MAYAPLVRTFREKMTNFSVVTYTLQHTEFDIIPVCFTKHV